MFDLDIEAQTPADDSTGSRERCSVQDGAAHKERTTCSKDYLEESEGHFAEKVESLRAPSVPSVLSRRSTDNESVTSTLSGAPRVPSNSSGHVNTAPEKYDAGDQGDDEAANLYRYAEQLRLESRPAQPWFMEMSRFRRINFLHINRELAQLRKEILDKQQAPDETVLRLRRVLHEQAEAIRDLQLIHSLDYLPRDQMEKRRQECMDFFPVTNRAEFDDTQPFDTENYLCLHERPQRSRMVTDGVRSWLRRYLSASISWSAEEKEIRPAQYKAKNAPETLSATAERLACFIVAMAGALFILVPMYIMALHESQTKNLVTTTVAVLLFALACSITLRISNDQILTATVGYAAVLMVFVGLTSSPSSNAT